MRTAPIEPRVSVIIAAYNEERVIGERLENALALDYPSRRLRDHRRLRRQHRRDRRDRRPLRRLRRAPAVAAAAGQDSRARCRGCRGHGRDSRLLRRQHHVRARRAARAGPQLRRPRRRRRRGPHRLPPRGQQRVEQPRREPVLGLRHLAEAPGEPDRQRRLGARRPLRRPPDAVPARARTPPSPTTSPSRPRSSSRATGWSSTPARGRWSSRCRRRSASSAVACG